MLIVINLKNYKIGTGVLKLAEKIETYLPKSIVAVPSVNIKEIAEKTKLNVFAQHVSPFEKGRATGYVIPDAVRATGAFGTLLNHSEHPLSPTEIYKTMIMANKSGLKIILCVSSLRNLGFVFKIKKLKPYAIAFESPELISTGKSITKYNPEAIKKFVSILKGTKIIPLCGAGINSASDILEAEKLGCEGVLIASTIANSKNPERILKDISHVIK